MQDKDTKNDNNPPTSEETPAAGGGTAGHAESPAPDGTSAVGGAGTAAGPAGDAKGKKNRRKKRFRISSLIIALIFIAGLGLILYPTVSDRWNSMHQTRAIAQYTERVSNLDPEDCVDIFEEAHAYNRRLYLSGHGLGLDEDELEEYERQLKVEGSSIIGYIDIAKISCHLPIALGTDEGTLQNAVGHLEGSSLPVGGENTHAVLSGHRGLPSAKLFTDLDLMGVGDTFVLHILTETLTYEVDQVLVVLPTETEALQIEPGKDYCTLLTCTPYGVNSHRMLVRGHRIENAPVEEGDTQTAGILNLTGTGGGPDIVTVFVIAALALAVIAGVILLIKPGRRKK